MHKCVESVIELGDFVRVADAVDEIFAQTAAATADFVDISEIRLAGIAVDLVFHQSHKDAAYHNHKFVVSVLIEFNF